MGMFHSDTMATINLVKRLSDNVHAEREKKAKPQRIVVADEIRGSFEPTSFTKTTRECTCAVCKGIYQAPIIYGDVYGGDHINIMRLVTGGTEHYSHDICSSCSSKIIDFIKSIKEE